MPTTLPAAYRDGLDFMKWTPMNIGYARSSTIDQEAGYQAQIRTLNAAGCEKVFSEKVSSVAHRTQLEAALEFAREGDTLVVTKLDRLARSVAHLVAIGEKLDAKGVSLKVLEQSIDTSTPTGRLMFNMLGAIAQFERELMLERQREGVAKAKLEGKYKGRAPTARAKAAEVRRLHSESIGARLPSAYTSVALVSIVCSGHPPRHFWQREVRRRLKC
jgi:DNA invertase Pin-like site-specific DNA recombinase